MSFFAKLIGDQTVPLVQQLANLEEQLARLDAELPSYWLTHKQILDKLEQFIRMQELNLDVLHDSAFGKSQETISNKFSQFEQKLKKVLSDTEKGVYFLEKENDLAKITQATSTMRELSTILHELLLLGQRYPFAEMTATKLWQQTIDGLRTGILLPPSLTYEEACDLFSKFVNETLVLVVRYNSSSSIKPHFFIWKDGAGSYKVSIVKFSPQGSSALIRRQLAISKAMATLDINAMIIDYKHKLVSDNFYDIQKIEFMEGIRLDTLGKLDTRDDVLRLSYFLGATCADGFLFNLTDRADNIQIDIRKFKQTTRKTLNEYLGKRNPLFNIDYELSTETNATFYLENQIFGTYGILAMLFMRRIDWLLVGIQSQEVRFAFNTGFLDELMRAIGMYNKHKAQVDLLLDNSGLSYIRDRFSIDHMKTVENLEDAFMKQIQTHL